MACHNNIKTVTECTYSQEFVVGFLGNIKIDVFNDLLDDFTQWMYHKIFVDTRFIPADAVISTCSDARNIKEIDDLLL